MPRESAAAAAHPPATYNNTLTINRLRLQVKLGCEKEERVTPQPVEIDVRFFFPALTESTLTDAGEFVCYDKISHSIKAACDKSEFRLIEFLATQIHKTIRTAVPAEIKILVKVTKCQLPVEFVLGGASFLYSDLPPFSWVIPD